MLMCMIAVLFIKIEYLNIFLKTSYISDMDCYVIQCSVKKVRRETGIIKE